MVKTDLLFQLIKSLSKGEKRNFKVLTQLTAGDKKYIQLFDSIDRTDKYDEEWLIRELNDEAFTRQFSVAKNYLYNSILKSLAYFYKGQTAENFSLSLQVRILMEKRLFNQAYRHLNKAMERAEKQENFYEILQLFMLERQILRQTDDYKKLNERIHEINLREKIVLEKLNNFQQYHFMYDQVVAFLTTDPKAKGMVAGSYFEPILKNSLMENESQALSIKAKIGYYTIQHRYYRALGDRKKALPFIEAIVNSYESYPEILEDEWMRYVEEVSALVSEYGQNNRKDEALKALKKLEHPRIKSRNGIDYYFPFYYTQLIGIYLNIGDVTKAAEVVSEFEIDLPRNLGKIPKYQELRLS